MTEQKIEGINPTRMELLEIGKKLTLAEKGHKLLEEKRDALVERFFSVIEERNQLSKEVDAEFKDAYLSLIQAQMIMGENKVEEISQLAYEFGEISFGKDNIMGVKIPKVDIENLKKDDKRFYGFFETCSKFDFAPRLH
jgi:V/A-type H+-transporting ATPase subunit D